MSWGRGYEKEKWKRVRVKIEKKMEKKYRNN
jgi:hypothetical protein